MKLRLRVRKEKRADVIEALYHNQIEISDDANFILYEVQHEQDYLLVKDQEEYLRIANEDILYIEGENAKVLVHTQHHVYTSRETMYALEAQLYEKGFLRIHKAYIVNKKAIHRISTSLNMKFILRMKNNDQIEVSRSYYYRFKEEMGF